MLNGDEFWARIDFIINMKGVTLYEVAEALGITRNTLYASRSRGSLPSIKTMVAMADYLCVSMDYLLGRSVVKEAEEVDKTLFEINYRYQTNSNFRRLIKALLDTT